LSTPAQAEMKLDGQLVPASLVEDPKAVETPSFRARLRQRYDEFTNRCGRSWARRDNVKSAGRSETLWSPRHGAHKVAIGVRVTVGVAEVGCPGSDVIESHFTPESDRSTRLSVTSVAADFLQSVTLPADHVSPTLAIVLSTPNPAPGAYTSAP
jgi:hypothetical protein